MRRLFVLLALLAVVLFALPTPYVVGEGSFTERLPGASLVSGFVSYTTRAEALPATGADIVWRVVEDSPGPVDGRPPFAIHVVEAASVSCFGQRGTLQVSFFNDRLYEVCFCADNPGALLAELMSQGLELVDGMEVARGDVAVAAVTTLHGRRYVRWQDVRLARQMERWLSKYS